MPKVHTMLSTAQNHAAGLAWLARRLTIGGCLLEHFDGHHKGQEEDGDHVGPVGGLCRSPTQTRTSLSSQWPAPASVRPLKPLSKSKWFERVSVGDCAGVAAAALRRCGFGRGVVATATHFTADFTPGNDGPPPPAAA